MQFIARATHKTISALFPVLHTDYLLENAFDEQPSKKTFSASPWEKYTCTVYQQTNAFMLVNTPADLGHFWFYDEDNNLILEDVLEFRRMTSFADLIQLRFIYIADIWQALPYLPGEGKLVVELINYLDRKGKITTWEGTNQGRFLEGSTPARLIDRNNNKLVCVGDVVTFAELTNSVSMIELLAGNQARITTANPHNFVTDTLLKFSGTETNLDNRVAVCIAENANTFLIDLSNLPSPLWSSLPNPFKGSVSRLFSITAIKKNGTAIGAVTLSANPGTATNVREIVKCSQIGDIIIGSKISFPNAKVGFSPDLLDYSIAEEGENGALFVRNKNIVRVGSGTMELTKSEYRIFEQYVRSQKKSPFAVLLLSEMNEESSLSLFGYFKNATQSTYSNQMGETQTVNFTIQEIK